MGIYIPVKIINYNRSKTRNVYTKLYNYIFLTELQRKVDNNRNRYYIPVLQKLFLGINQLLIKLHIVSRYNFPNEPTKWHLILETTLLVDVLEKFLIKTLFINNKKIQWYYIQNLKSYYEIHIYHNDLRLCSLYWFGRSIMWRVCCRVANLEAGTRTLMFKRKNNVRWIR